MRNPKVVLLWVAIVALSGVLVLRVQGALAERDDRQEQDRLEDERSRTDGEDPAEASEEPAPVELTTQAYDRGDCVTWDQRGGLVQPEVVDCANPHLIEMIASREVDQGPDAPYPNPGQWLGLIDELCRPVVGDYLDDGLDPFGRLGAGSVYPLESAWESGRRQIWCGVQEVPDSVAVMVGEEQTPFEGFARDLDQARLLPIGACVHFSGPTVVVCSKPHHAVVTAHLDLSPLSDRPDDEELRRRCDEAGAAADASTYATPSYVRSQQLEHRHPEGQLHPGDLRSNGRTHPATGDPSMTKKPFWQCPQLASLVRRSPSVAAATTRRQRSRER